MTPLGPARARDPVLAAYLLFAVLVTAYDLAFVVTAPFDVPVVRQLHERATPFTDWVPSMSYAFSLYSGFSALNGNARNRSWVPLFPAMQVALGLLSWFGLGGARPSPNAFLRISPWRPLWTIALPLVWVALLLAVKPRAKAA